MIFFLIRLAVGVNRDFGFLARDGVAIGAIEFLRRVPLVRFDITRVRGVLELGVINLFGLSGGGGASALGLRVEARHQIRVRSCADQHQKQDDDESLHQDS